ncbi:hypothetical protein Y032_0084g1771 [Ancylostoma ceylanicum]|uniref:G-protein coupled receptors family 1 profile domain-containing protein n=1 Tax=Ancylostoma ceylanicum TaxID=53326 RepID=A0A016TR41_9BILA|nr:hypothetical protein Y032_0084g1771 [Ancylostoma ceylanicum]
MEDDYRVSKYCVVIEIIIFNIVGNFGNVHLIWTSIRKKSTHTKPGMLLGVNAVFHIVCLVSELFNAAFLLSGEPIVRRVCYPYMVVYIYTICQQAVMILMISLDLLISLLFPFWHRKFPTIPYVIGMIALSSVYSFTVAIWGWKAKDDGIIPFCNPPLSLAPKVSRFWSLSNLIINCTVVIIYVTIICILIFRVKNKMRTQRRRVVRRLKVVLAVFFLSWFVAILGVDIGYILLPADILPIWQSNMVLFAMICYSQTFYACIWRSREYRGAFREQLAIMTCRTPQPYETTSLINSLGGFGNRIFKRPYPCDV